MKWNSSFGLKIMYPYSIRDLLNWINTSNKHGLLGKIEHCLLKKQNVHIVRHGIQEEGLIAELKISLMRGAAIRMLTFVIQVVPVMARGCFLGWWGPTVVGFSAMERKYQLQTVGEKKRIWNWADEPLGNYLNDQGFKKKPKTCFLIAWWMTAATLILILITLIDLSQASKVPTVVTP